jgi:two-component system, NarL family, invasion response regulator UvrY
MIRVLIADDHAVVRRGVGLILAEKANMTVVGEAQNHHELLTLVRKQPCELVVLDVSMPGRSGFDVLKDVKQERPRLPVLILSMYPEDQYAVRALRAGAAGYLNKDSAPEELVAAARKVVNGGRYVSPLVAEKLVSDLTWAAGRPPHEALSNREFQVMCMIGSGKSVTEVADEMALSVKTVSTYRSRVLEKMGMKNNAELTHYTIHNRLV